MFYNFQKTPSYIADLFQKESPTKNSIIKKSNQQLFSFDIVEKAPPYILDNNLISSFQKLKDNNYAIQSSEI